MLSVIILCGLLSQNTFIYASVNYKLVIFLLKRIIAVDFFVPQANIMCSEFFASPKPIVGAIDIAVLGFTSVAFPIVSNACLFWIIRGGLHREAGTLPNSIVVFSFPTYAINFREEIFIWSIRVYPHPLFVAFICTTRGITSIAFAIAFKAGALRVAGNVTKWE